MAREEFASQEKLLPYLQTIHPCIPADRKKPEISVVKSVKVNFKLQERIRLFLQRMIVLFMLLLMTRFKLDFYSSKLDSNLDIAWQYLNMNIYSTIC